MKLRKRKLVSLLFGALCFRVTSTALGQTGSDPLPKARERIARGKELYQAGDYEDTTASAVAGHVFIDEFPF